jgi:2-(1,2-epoxy-1,2-dihydrophenyl)acetyl-CoA isomerase
MSLGMEFCARLAAGPTATYARMKENVTFAETHNFKELLDLEAYHWKMSQLGHDHRQSIVAFLEKRKPVFTGR